MAIALGEQQKLAGHSVEIWSMTGSGPCEDLAKRAGLGVRCFGQKKGFQLSIVKEMIVALRSSRIEVLHTHNPMPHYYAAAAKLFAGRNILVHTRHNMGDDLANSTRAFVFRLTMMVTKAAVFVCLAARNRLVPTGVIPESKAKVVPNGIDLEQYRQSTEQSKAEFWASLKREVPRIVFGSVGRLSEVKNHPMMIEAFALALPKLPADAQLLLAGDGPSRGKIEQLIRDRKLENNVIVLGERSDIPFVLGGIDVFLQSSVSEAYSLALLEAAASGLPCIASNVGGNNEIIEEGVTGFLVAKDDIEAFGALLVKLGANRDLLNQMGQAAYVWAQKFGGLKQMYDKYQSLYFD
jgi:glycosyltransferase involved in cell wall biosynthesis